MALMGYDFAASALLGKHKSNVDAAFLEGAWRYIRLLGSSCYKIIDSKTFFELPEAPSSSASGSGAGVAIHPLGVSGSAPASSSSSAAATG